MRFLLVSVLCIIAFAGSARASAAPKPRSPLQRAAAAGRVTLFPFVTNGNNVLGPLAFAPDDTAFFVDAPDELVRFNVDGSYQKFFVNRATFAGIAYAYGRVWITCAGGIVRVKPDGSGSQFLQQPETPIGLQLEGDGFIYFTQSNHGLIGRIDATGHSTFRSVAPSVYPLPPLGLTPDGSLFFTASYETQDGIGRLDRNARVAWFNTFTPNTGFAALGKYLYFGTVDTSGIPGYLGRLAENGTVKQIVTQTTLSLGDVDAVAVRAPYVWFTGTPISEEEYSSNLNLYRLDTRDDTISGPYQPKALNSVFDLTTGPDGNLWLFTYNTTGTTGALYFGHYVPSAT